MREGRQQTGVIVGGAVKYNVHACEKFYVLRFYPYDIIQFLISFPDNMKLIPDRTTYMIYNSVIKLIKIKIIIY